MPITISNGAHAVKGLKGEMMSIDNKIAIIRK